MNGDKIELGNGNLTALKLHFFYIVLILCSSLILLATRDWTKLEGFTEYLSVSATLTSLVLGVLAIIYGFVSSNSTNNFLGSVEASAREMKGIGSELRTIFSNGQELQAKAQDRNEELHALIGNLRTTIETLSASTTNIAGAVEVIPLKLESLRVELAGKATQPTAELTTQSTSQALNKDQAKHFLGVSSLLGLAALRALQSAKYQTRPCDLGFIFKGNFLDSYDYVHGYLIASSCLGIVDFDIDGKSRTASKIVFPKVLEIEEMIDAEWERRAGGSDDVAKESIKKYTDKIEESFVQQVPVPQPAPSSSGGGV